MSQTEKIRLTQAVIVEGKYDKIKLSSILDAVIIPTDGFSIYKDKEKLELIKALAIKSGIIILTDSDTAGFQIRSYIKGAVHEGEIINVYCPELLGKEKRKRAPSKEGMLGVEGIPVNALVEAFSVAGVGFKRQEPNNPPISKMDLYNDGLSGTDGSRTRRLKLLKQLGLPSLLSANSIPGILNTLLTRDQYKQAIKRLDEEC